MKILVNVERCSGCGTCANNCPQDVFELKEGKSHVVNSEDCLGCHLCEVTCETGAITLDEGY